MAVERACDSGISPAGSAERPSKSRSELPSLLTTAEVAEFLAVSERTVRRLVARGRLPCIRVGGQVRYSAV